MTKLLCIIALAFVLVVPAGAQEARCPSSQGKNPLLSVSVFDGPPEEMADLKPDVTRGRSDLTYASWDVGYLFDRGRTLYLVCRYSPVANAIAITVKVDQKVKQCVFRARSRSKPAELICK